MAMVNTDRGVYAAEQAAAASLTLDHLRQPECRRRHRPGLRGQYPGLAEDHSLNAHWQEMMARGDESMTGFVNGIKGKVAEFGAADQLRDAGWTNVEIAPESNQPVFDITATPPDGGDRQSSGRSRPEVIGYSYEIEDAMAEDPDVLLRGELRDIRPDSGILPGCGRPDDGHRGGHGSSWRGLRRAWKP